MLLEFHVCRSDLPWDIISVLRDCEGNRHLIEFCGITQRTGNVSVFDNDNKVRQKRSVVNCGYFSVYTSTDAAVWVFSVWWKMNFFWVECLQFVTFCKAVENFDHKQRMFSAAIWRGRSHTGIQRTNLYLKTLKTLLTQGLMWQEFQLAQTHHLVWRLVIILLRPWRRLTGSSSGCHYLSYVYQHS